MFFLVIAHNEHVVVMSEKIFCRDCQTGRKKRERESWTRCVLGVERLT